MPLRRQHRNHSVSVPPVNAEVGIERKDLAVGVELRQPDEARVCKGHGKIAVTLHQRAEVSMLFVNSKADTNHSTFEQSKDGIGFASLALQKKGCFGDNRFACQQ